MYSGPEELISINSSLRVTGQGVPSTISNPQERPWRAASAGAGCKQSGSSAGSPSGGPWSSQLRAHCRCCSLSSTNKVASPSSSPLPHHGCSQAT